MTERIDAGTREGRHRDHMSWTILILDIGHHIREHESPLCISMMYLHSSTVICLIDIERLKCLSIDDIFCNTKTDNEITWDIIDGIEILSNSEHTSRS